MTPYRRGFRVKIGGREGKKGGGGSNGHVHKKNIHK